MTPAFVEIELNYRRQLGYPPFRRLARIVFSYTDPLKAQQQAESVASRLREILQRKNMTGKRRLEPARNPATEEYDRHQPYRSGTLLFYADRPALSLASSASGTQPARGDRTVRGRIGLANRSGSAGFALVDSRFLVTANKSVYNGI